MSTEQPFTPRLTKFYGWGTADAGVTVDEERYLRSVVDQRLGGGDGDVTPPRTDEISLPVSRITLPDTLTHALTIRHDDRVAHAAGKSFVDMVHAFDRDLRHAPDAVAYPADEADVAQVLDWAADAGVAVIPFGGGTSVVGGVTPDTGDDRPTVSLDLQRLDRVLSVDQESRAAEIQSGVLGPHLAEQLKPHDLQLRHYPQSYEFSTLGGWIATRAGGHYATGPTHIDDFVESVHMVTPAGQMTTRRLPASGAGPDPNRWVLGSEGTLGVVTRAWMRLQRRPRYRAGATCTFPDLSSAVAAVRAIAQSGLQPANLRMLDRTEALTTLAGDGTAEVLVLGFESADHDVTRHLDLAAELVRDHGGTITRQRDTRSGGAGAWRSAFLRMPYYREVLLPLSVINETFETACTWDRFFDLHEQVTTATTEALRTEIGGHAQVTCRFTHVYPDGVAPYFTVLAHGDRSRLAPQWQVVKQAASEAIIAAGGTITHHHAVGRDHMPGYRAERPELFAAMLRAAKDSVDPRGIMNPRVLLDEGRPQEPGGANAASAAPAVIG